MNKVPNPELHREVGSSPEDPSESSDLDSEEGRSRIRPDEPSPDLHEEPRLNLDILRLICHCITDIPSVLPFALTCSALTEDALRRRLTMAPIDLCDGVAVERFHAFIFSNEQSRAPRIYGLNLLGSYDGPQFMHKSDFQIITNRIVDIVKAAVRIQYLDFKTSIGNSVFNAVVKLTTLRELRIHNDVLVFQEPLLIGLNAFRSPLRALHVTGTEPIGGAICASFLHNCLAHLAPTLESLIMDDFIPDIVSSSVTTQFTAIRSLKLLTPSFPHDYDLLGLLLRLFPNLDDTLELGSLDTYISIADFPAFRQLCEEAQRQHCWSRLDRLVCNVGTAYLVALRCPIRRMDIEVGSPSATARLADVLRNHCPQQVYVRISLCDGFSALDGMFPLEAAGKLTHLVIFANIGIRYGRRSSHHTRGSNSAHSARILNRLLSSIKHLRLTHLRVVFRYHHIVHESMPMRKAMPKADSVDDIGLSSDGMDFSVTMARFVDTLPSLGYLFLTSCGATHAVPSTTSKRPTGLTVSKTLNTWHTSKAWRAINDGDGDLHPSDSDVGLGPCVELGKEATERIIDREKLQLTRGDEDEVQWCREAPSKRVVIPWVDNLSSLSMMTVALADRGVSDGRSMV